MGRFCLDCDKRATCKAMCKALKKHLAHTCRAKNSPKAALWGDMRDMEQHEMDAGNHVERVW